MSAPPATNRRRLRVAVVGCGPSGMYAAEALATQDTVPVAVDIFDRLPAPFGLVRYGVAPDHLSLRSVRTSLEAVLSKPGVRLLANVEVGIDLSTSELHGLYDAIIFAYGAARDRRIGIPGEDLPGSISATNFVNWYCGHPDAHRALIESAVRAAHHAVVVGVGNVAIDVARVLAKTPAELAHTDMPQHVLDLLAGSAVTDIWILGRRGPAQATFTTKELRELGELADADVRVNPDDLELDPTSADHIAHNRLRARNIDVLQDWAHRETGRRKRHIHVSFLTRPVEVLGTDHVTGIRTERTRLGPNGSAEGTGEFATIPADLVIRSIGYRGEPLGELPFDSTRAVISNDHGRVTRDDHVVPGEYAVGWIKRGPTGIIGTNKKDAAHTVAALLEDADHLLSGPETDADAVTTLLSSRHVRYINLDGWHAIDAAEIALGATRGRARTTLHERDTLLAATRPRCPTERPRRGELA